MEFAKEWNNSGSQDEEKDHVIQNEAVHVVGKDEYVTKVVSETGGVVDFQARLQGLYGKPEEPNMERNFMLLSKAWNKPDAMQEFTGQRLKNEVYRVERSASLEVDEVSSQSEASNLHVSLQDWNKHVDQFEMERAYIELAEEWNSSMVECEEEGSVRILKC